VLVAPSAWPRWAYKWVAIFAGCKWLTWRRTLVAGVPWWRHAGYLLAWPGLDAATFLGARCRSARATRVDRRDYQECHGRRVVLGCGRLGAGGCAAAGACAWACKGTAFIISL
jgi:hypothetical protein